MPVAIRNSLLLVLAGTAGYFDALCYLALTVFPANMTGNTVLLSIALVQEDAQAIVNSGLALLGFVAGAALGVWIVHSEVTCQAAHPRTTSSAGHPCPG